MPHHRQPLQQIQRPRQHWILHHRFVWLDFLLRAGIRIQRHPVSPFPHQFSLVKPRTANGSIRAIGLVCQREVRVCRQARFRGCLEGIRIIGPLVLPAHLYWNIGPETRLGKCQTVAHFNGARRDPQPRAILERELLRHHRLARGRAAQY